MGRVMIQTELTQGRATSDVRGVLLTVVSASAGIGAEDDGLRGRVFRIGRFPWTELSAQLRLRFFVKGSEMKSLSYK